MDYRAYVLTRDGKVDNVIVLECSDDASALESAGKLVDGHDIQLWQLDRLLGTFPARPRNKP